MQQRDFLLDCDRVMKYAIDTGQYRKRVIKSELSLTSDIGDIHNYTLKRGHVETKEILVTNEGKAFFRQTSYVEEYDKQYRKEEIEYLETEYKPRKIIINERTYIIALLLLIATIIGILKCK